MADQPPQAVIYGCWDALICGLSYLSREKKIHSAQAIFAD